MDAKQYLTMLTRSTEEFLGFRNVNWQPARYDPQHVGAFGATKTDRYSQVITIAGEKFTVTVEKDPNQ
jgi:hypothetical protein